MPRLGSYDQSEKENHRSLDQVNIKSRVPQRDRYEIKQKKTKPRNKSHLVHPSITALRSPASSCSESNISEMTSSVHPVPSAFSSCRDSSAYSDYEEYDDYLPYENIGSGILCRVEMAEEVKPCDSKGNEIFALQRSSSFTEDRSEENSS